MMQFQESIKTCFNKFSDFNGRASRSEFWWFVLFVAIANMVAESIFPGKIGYIIGIILLIPHICVGVRRLHDIGKPAAWILLTFIPVIGLILIYWWIQKSEPIANQYGAPPADAQIG
jgi:uncharacterized membrane protein YhaH (DUF805 family)